MWDGGDFGAAQDSNSDELGIQRISDSGQAGEPMRFASSCGLLSHFPAFFQQGAAAQNRISVPTCNKPPEGRRSQDYLGGSVQFCSILEAGPGRGL